MTPHDLFQIYFPIWYEKKLEIGVCLCLSPLKL
jgi:hypothetical protein